MSSDQLCSLIPHDCETPLLRSITLRSYAIMKETQISIIKQLVELCLQFLTRPLLSPLGHDAASATSLVQCEKCVGTLIFDALFRWLWTVKAVCCVWNPDFKRGQNSRWRFLFFVTGSFCKREIKNVQNKIQQEMEVVPMFGSLLWHFLSSFLCHFKPWGTCITAFF